jgi:hypothetical protein
MKKKIQYYYAQAAVLAYILVIGFACNIKDDLTNDVKLHLSTDVLMNPLSLYFKDGNPANGAINVPIAIEISGRDADKIFSVIGKNKNLVADGQIFNVGIRKKFAPSATNPIMFTITAKAEGYMDAVTSFVLTTPNFRLDNVNMIKKSAPPTGINVKTSSSTTTSIAVNDFYTEVEAANSNNEKLGFRIKAGTKFFDPAGKELNGNVFVSIAYMSGIVIDEEGFLPGGTDGTMTVMELNGKPRKPSTAAMASNATVDVYVGNVKATNFTNSSGDPLETIMELNDNITDPTNNNSLIKAGDQMPIWSYSEQNPVWLLEYKIPIIKNSNNKLQVTFQHNHLTDFMAGWMIPVGCVIKAYRNPVSGDFIAPDSDPILKISSNLTPVSNCESGKSSLFYTEIVGTQSNNVLSRSYQEYYNDREIHLADLIGGGEAEAAGFYRIYDGTEEAKGQLLFEKSISFCSSNVLNIGDKLPQKLQVSIVLNAECPDLAIIYPSLPLLYRETGKTSYRLLGYVNNGAGCSNELQKGKQYDFKIAFGGIEKEYLGLIVPSQDSTVTIDFKGVTETINWDYQGDNKDKIILKYENFRIPDALCEEYKRYVKGG